jgi:SAM-dependent methyltransferase
VNAETWDERYAASELVWGAAPNRWVEQECAALPPGTAVDLACGEGRNALWLAELGWRVTAVDFSAVGLQKGRAAEEHSPPAHAIDWVCADVTGYRHPQPVDLVLISYLQVIASERRAVVRTAADTLAPGGVLVVVAHHSRNLSAGTGGPQDPTVLYSAEDVVADLDGAGLVIDTAEQVMRPVDGAPRPAIDTLLRAHRTAAPTVMT